MKTLSKDTSPESKGFLRWAFIAIFVVMAFTGFGQMPIFKRYYISDIPGMGWSADFYLTHTIHYLGASILLALFAYSVLDYFLSKRRSFKLTPSAYLRIALLVGIVTTGAVRVLKNMPDVVFSPNFTVMIDVVHLGFVMIYLLTALILVVLKSTWTIRKSI